jgi:hypothetical protein
MPIRSKRSSRTVAAPRRGVRSIVSSPALRATARDSGAGAVVELAVRGKDRALLARALESIEAFSEALALRLAEPGPSTAPPVSLHRSSGIEATQRATRGGGAYLSLHLVAATPAQAEAMERTLRAFCVGLEERLSG